MDSSIQWKDFKYILMNRASGTHFVEYNGIASEFLNATIIGIGYAQPMPISPNVKYAEVFEKLYKEAREQEMGLWGSNDEKIKNQRAIEEGSWDTIRNSNN